MKAMRAVAAASFETPLSPEDMLARLATSSGRTWSRRESHWHGEYLSSILRDDDGELMVRVYFENAENRPILTAFLYSRATDEASALKTIDDLFNDEILPSLLADNIKEMEYFD